MEKCLWISKVLVTRLQLLNLNQLELEILLHRKGMALLPPLGMELLYLHQQGLSPGEPPLGDLGLSGI